MEMVSAQQIGDNQDDDWVDLSDQLSGENQNMPSDIQSSFQQASDASRSPTLASNSDANKRKVGRPVTSPRTMARNFPTIDEIKNKIATGECFTRPRSGSGNSDVWRLFQEVAFADNQDFTGIVRCRSCSFMTRYHGQITGTSHMRRHRCFHEAYPDAVNESTKSDDPTSPKRKRKLVLAIEPTLRFDEAKILQNFVEVLDANTHEFINYMSCKRCKLLVRYDTMQLASHSCRQREISAPSMVGDTLVFRPKPKHRMTPAWENFEEVIDPSTDQILGYARCKTCRTILRTVDVKAIPKILRSHECNDLVLSGSSSPKEETNGILNDSSTRISSHASKLINIKGDLREKCIQFCYTELVPLESITSESFKSLAQSVLKLGAQIGRGSVALPDNNQLQSQVQVSYSQVKDRIRNDLNSALDINVGCALVCDSQDDLCVISAYYINKSWALVETVLSASVMIHDINSFISTTLDDYQLNQQQKLSKFTFVSRGGFFDGVSVCLTSMAHVVDGVIENMVFKDDSYNEIIDSCRVICYELKLDVEIYRVDWVNRFEVMRHVIENQHKFELKNSTLDMEAIKSLVNFLSPFKAASVELRQCHKHPTINHVLLWYYKLMKALAVLENDNQSTKDLKKHVRKGIEENFQLQPIHKIAAFLWPNFRFLKMLSVEEREDVYREVRNLLDTRISCILRKEKGLNKSGGDFVEWEDVNDEVIDEVNKYISVQLTTCNEKNILSWWMEHANEFPRLSCLAKWILSIPASVTFLERYKISSAHEVSEELLFLHFNFSKKPFKRSLVMDKAVRTSWDKKMQLKQDRKAAKELAEQIKAAKIEAIENKKKRREENRRRREENARKSEIVQVIKNPKKLKRLAKKKQKKIRKIKLSQ